MTDDDRRQAMVAWHKACVHWACATGDDLPEWALDITSRDATPADVRRLNRASERALVFGTAPPGAKITGILDFIPRGPSAPLTEQQFIDAARNWRDW